MNYLPIITGCLFMILGGIVATAGLTLAARWGWVANRINDEFDPWNKES